METIEKIQRGNYVKRYGMANGSEEVVGQYLLLMKQQAEESLSNEQQDIDDFAVSYYFKTGWENTDGAFSEIRKNKNDIPCYKVGWTAIKKE